MRLAGSSISANKALLPHVKSTDRGAVRRVRETKKTLTFHSQCWGIYTFIFSLYHLQKKSINGFQYGGLMSGPDICSTLPQHVHQAPVPSCNLWHYQFQSGFAIVGLNPAGLLAKTLKNSYSKCLAYNPRHPSTGTGKLCLLAGVISDLRWKRFLHLIRIPGQSKLLHMETGLASLIELVVAWLSHKCSTSLRINTKKVPKPQSEKAGFTRPLIWVAIDIPSTHRFTKANGERIPASFTRAPLGTGCKTRRLIKTNARKQRKNRGNVEKQRSNGHWNLAADREKVALFRAFVRSSGGRLRVRAEADQALCLNHWKSEERAKTKPERLWKPLKSNKNHLIDHRIKGLFGVPFPTVSFQSWEDFVDGKNEPVWGFILTFSPLVTKHRFFSDKCSATSFNLQYFHVNINSKMDIMLWT